MSKFPTVHIPQQDLASVFNVVLEMKAFLETIAGQRGTHRLPECYISATPPTKEVVFGDLWIKPGTPSEVVAQFYWNSTEWVLLTVPTSTTGLLPAGGTTGQKLVKATNDDYDVIWSTDINPTEFQTLVCGDETTDHVTGIVHTTRFPYAVTVGTIYASLTDAATGASKFTVDVLLNGVSVFTTKITLDATERTSSTASVAAVLLTTAFAAHDEIEIEITQIGSTLAGKGLKVHFVMRRN